MSSLRKWSRQEPRRYGKQTQIPQTLFSWTLESCQHVCLHQVCLLSLSWFETFSWVADGKRRSDEGEKWGPFSRCASTCTIPFMCTKVWWPFRFVWLLDICFSQGTVHLFVDSFCFPIVKSVQLCAPGECRGKSFHFFRLPSHVRSCNFANVGLLKNRVTSGSISEVNRKHPLYSINVILHHKISSTNGGWNTTRRRLRPHHSSRWWAKSSNKVQYI